MDIAIPPLVLQRAQAHGSIGQEWIDGLPGVLTSLQDAWGLTLGPVYSGGTAGLVLDATGTNGASFVLKIAMPLDHDEIQAFAHTLRAHEIADGRGCARLIAADMQSSAMLLERLGPNLADLQVPLPDLLDTIARTLRSFWHSLDGVDHDFPTGATKALWLRDFIEETWEQLDRPCERRVIDEAVEFCHARADAFNPATSVLVHGDAHGWNTVATSSGDFAFVDPEGVWSERAHDLAVPMREYNEPLLAGDTMQLTIARCERLSSICDVDPEAVWEWGLIERVSTGLANLRDFDSDEGATFLTVAERCVRA